MSIVKMELKVAVILFLVVICECNGHIPILGDILSSAHERVEGVAKTVLGGLNLNLFGANRQNNPQNVPQKGPEETIIVVVEESGHGDYGNAHNHGPPRPPPPHHHPRPPFNNNSPPPPPPPHHHRRPPFDDHPPPPPPPPPHHHQRPPFNHDSGYPPPPHHHHHQRPHGDPRPGSNGQNYGPYHQNEYGNDQNSGNQQNYNNIHGNNQNSRPYDTNNGNNKEYQPNNSNNKDIQENQGINKNTNQYYDNPTTEYGKTTYTAKPKDETNKVTEKPTDGPLFVPLNQDEYVYGGDKINITAPKRDTDKTKPNESDDEDFAIDIRLKN